MGNVCRRAESLRRQGGFKLQGDGPLLVRRKVLRAQDVIQGSHQVDYFGYQNGGSCSEGPDWLCVGARSRLNWYVANLSNRSSIRFLYSGPKEAAASR